MNTLDRPVIVGWDSQVDPKPTLDALAEAGVMATVASGDDKPDVAVLDARNYHNLKAAMARYHEVGVPCVMLVESHAQEVSVLAQLQPIDDACLTEQAQVQLPLRFVRMARRISVELEVRNRPSFMDLLTGLENRHSFFLHFFEDIHDCGPESPLSLLILDLDHFKQVNDSYGHSGGDQVLASVAEILRRVCRGAAGIGRYGGEEFVISIRADHEQALRLAEFIRSEIGDHEFLPDHGLIHVTASIGVATSEGGPSGEELMQEADRALYAAKADGRNAVRSAGRPGGSEEARADLVVQDFENRIRVLTERLIKGVAARGKSMVKTIREEADHDGLTALYVRRYFDRRMDREFEKAVSDGRPLSLIFLDIDNFGSVNKRYGFPSGDRTLRYVSGVIKDSVRVIDWVARYGGEELCVVLPDTGCREARQVAERIRSRIESGTVTAYDGGPIKVTASLGVGERLEEEKRVVDFVQRVSDLTRDAKAAGKNRVVGCPSEDR